MAIFHSHIQIIGRKAGRSSTAAAAYRAGEMLFDTRTDTLHDYTRRKGIVSAKIFAPAGSLGWVYERNELWNAVEKVEKRKDSQLARELNIALPHELNSLQRTALIYAYVKQNFVAMGMVADVCIHKPIGGDDARNHHAHVMLTMRQLEGDGFGPKETSWNVPELVVHWRKSWAEMTNAALEKAGFDCRIDHRSNEERGLDELPGSHQGPVVNDILKKGKDSEVAERQQDERSAREQAQLAAQLAIARAQATAADAELQQIEREAAERQRERVASALAGQTADRERKRVAQAERQRQRERVAQVLAEAERVQAEQLTLSLLIAAQEAQAVEAEHQRLEAAARAARVEQAQAIAQAAQQAAAAAAKAAQERAQAERQRLESEAKALALARQEYQKAERVLAAAVRAEGAAKTAVEQLQSANDRAVIGIEEAGKSFLKTTKSFSKARGWSAAISAYKTAEKALDEAFRAVSIARQMVVLALGRVLELDPAERTRHAAKTAPQASQAAKVWVAPATAHLQAPRALQPVPALHQHKVHHDPDDDDESSGPAPGM